MNVLSFLTGPSNLDVAELGRDAGFSLKPVGKAISLEIVVGCRR